MEENNSTFCFDYYQNYKCFKSKIRYLENNWNFFKLIMTFC